MEEAIRFGKCKHSPKGKVVLPTGAHVPHSITGMWLHNHVDEWHRQNLGQMAAQMYFEVTVAPPVTAPCHATASQILENCPGPSVARRPGHMPAGIYALKWPFPPCPKVVITTLPLHKHGHAGPDNNPRGAVTTSPVSEEGNASPPKQDKGPAPAPVLEIAQEPTHLYTFIPDATHSIHTGPTRPTVKEPGPGRHKPGYHNTVHIYNLWVAQTVYKRAMETLITVMQRELLSLAPKMQT